MLENCPHGIQNMLEMIRYGDFVFDFFLGRVAAAFTTESLVKKPLNPTSDYHQL